MPDTPSSPAGPSPDPDAPESGTRGRRHEHGRRQGRGQHRHRHGPRLAIEDVNVVPRSRIRPAIRGTVVGNFMEWYDFGIYGYLTVTMTAVFTEGLPDSLQLLAVMFGLAVSYIVRPIGGLVLGPLGDRIGRQKVLCFTMAAMAIATALIGVLPTAATIGSGAALVLLYLLKLVQGFSTGGEYAGATTYVAEFAPDRNRGYFGSFLDMGSYLGFAAGATVVAVVTLITQAISGPDAMTDDGWRIPFLTAIPLGAVAVYLRSRIPETPAFENEQQTAGAPAASSSAPDGGSEQAPEAAFTSTDHRDGRFRRWLGPLVTLIRENRAAILIGIAIVAASNTAGYALTSYMPVYLEEEIGLHTTGAALAGIALLWFQETARKPLMGSFPTVETDEEARALVAGQDDNPDLDLHDMLFPEVTRASAPLSTDHDAAASTVRRSCDPGHSGMTAAAHATTFFSP